MKKKIYLACPYSDKDYIRRYVRVEKATKCAAKLLEMGYLVYSPLTHTAAMAKHLSPEFECSWEFWKDISFTFLDWADELWVLKLPGWGSSIGVQAEIAQAAEQFKLIQYATPKQILERTHPALMVN